MQGEVCQAEAPCNEATGSNHLPDMRVTSLSSGEEEFYALVSATSTALGAAKKTWE